MRRWLAPLAFCLLLAFQLDLVALPTLLASLVVAQSISAAVYMISARRARRLRTRGEANA